MSIATYSDLQQYIKDLVDDPTVNDYVVDHITLGATDIKNDKRVRFMTVEKIASASTSTTSQYLSLPTGFLAIKRMHITGSPQHNINVVSMRGLNNYYQSAPGKPSFVAVTDGQFEFNRLPETVYSVEIVYDAITDLSDSATTNEIFPAYPNLYVYAAAIHSATFLQDDNMLARFKMLYEDAATKYSEADKLGRFASPLRTRPRPGRVA